MLDEAKINKALNSDFWELKAFDTTTSTNLIVKEAIAQGKTNGFAACALQQKGGYGRQGRQWISPYGGLYISFSVCPDLEFEKLPSFALIISLAARRALKRFCGLSNVSIKWPNDVLCSEAKLAGISLEVIQGNCLCAGIGFNVFKPYRNVITSTKYRVAYVSNQLEVRQAFPFAIGNAKEDGLTRKQEEFMSQFLVAFLQEMELYYRLWKEKGFAAFKDEYSEALAFKGYTIAMEATDGTVLEEGILLDIDDEGHLLIKQSSGTIRAVSSGEVHITSFKK